MGYVLTLFGWISFGFVVFWTDQTNIDHAVLCLMGVAFFIGAIIVNRIDKLEKKIDRQFDESRGV